MCIRDRYEYVYNSDGKLISTIDFKALKEYTYYDMGNLSKYTEKSFVLDGNVIKSRTVDFSIVYEYEDGKLVRTNYISSDGSTRTVSTEYPEKENRIVRFEAGGKTVTSRSKTDGFGRKTFDELQLGTGFVSRQFSYYGGQVTEEHSEKMCIRDRYYFHSCISNPRISDSEVKITQPQSKPLCLLYHVFP